jgi:hypothetical protein
MIPQPLTSPVTSGAVRITPSTVAACTITLCGAGAVGRALADHIPAFGISRLNVIDPKPYSDRSIATQCAPHDVGHFKADVVARLARKRGLDARPYTTDLFSVPDGILGEAGIVVSCTDNSRALIGANRLAARMRCRLLKVNIEPLCDTISVRAYWPCAPQVTCAECQLSDRHYDRQLHPHSCDAEGVQRSTNSPRALSAATANMAIEALGAMLAEGSDARDWYGYETLHNCRTGQTTRSALERFDECRWDHTCHWSNVFWLSESPVDVSLEQLVPRAQRTPSSQIRFSFDHCLTRWVCCDGCFTRRRATRWFADLQAVVGTCPQCAGALRPFPFGVRQSATSHQLRDVYRQPLADWGVPTGAVIEVDSQGYVRTFVLGGANPAGVINSITKESI